MRMIVHDNGRTESLLVLQDGQMGELYGQPRGSGLAHAADCQFVDAEQFVTIRRTFRAIDAYRNFWELDSPRQTRRIAEEVNAKLDREYAERERQAREAGKVLSAKSLLGQIHAWLRD